MSSLSLVDGDATGTRKAAPDIPAPGPDAAFSVLKSSDGEVSVFPGAIEFKDVLPGNTYSASLHVQITGNRTRRIRLGGPRAASGFEAACAQLASLAPGLETVVSIQFNATAATAARAVVEALQIKVDGAAPITVRLSAAPPRAALRVSPAGPVDFGVVARGAEVSRSFIVANTSGAAGCEVAVSAA